MSNDTNAALISSVTQEEYVLACSRRCGRQFQGASLPDRLLTAAQWLQQNPQINVNVECGENHRNYQDGQWEQYLALEWDETPEDFRRIFQELNSE